MNKKKMGLFEKIINIVLDILIFLFGIILLVSIYKSIQIKVLGNDYSSFFGYSIFEVKTGSMADTINIGDWIVVKSSPKIKLNDIVTYRQDGEFITHRVIESYKGTYITKGDANTAKDDPITQDQIVGKVNKILPHFGIFRKTLFNPLVLVMLIITVYVFSYVVKKNQKEEKSDSNRMDKVLEELINKTKKIIISLQDKETKTKMQKVKAPKIVEKKEAQPVKKVINEKPSELINDIKAEQVTSSNVENEIDVEQIKNEVFNDDEFDKTKYFRVIPVDKDELDSTYLGIKKNQELEDELNAKKKKPIVNNAPVEEVNDSLIKNKLEMLHGKKNKRSKNIIGKIMFLKSEEISEIINIITKDEKMKTNEATIKETLIDAYIDAKYYNYCGNINVEYNGRNMNSRIAEALNNIMEKMINDYSGSDSKYAEKVAKYANIFNLLIYIDQTNFDTNDISTIRESYVKKFNRLLKGQYDSEKQLNDIINSIIKDQKLYKGMIKYTIKKLETNSFDLSFNQLSSKRNLFALELDHNISFSKVYSEYIVDKAYSEGTIAEDKTIVLAALLLVQLTKDMLSQEFNRKYIIYVPETLYDKDNKLGKLLKMTEDEFVKNNIIILIRYSELIKNKKIVKELRKNGYRFALVFDETTIIKEKDQSIISVAEYIFMNKKKVDAASMLPSIPENLQNSIIYEDIASKVGNYGGE